eukprot:953404-Prorocentrum_minimum.AAC.2
MLNGYQQCHKDVHDRHVITCSAREADARAAGGSAAQRGAGRADTAGPGSTAGAHAYQWRVRAAAFSRELRACHAVFMQVN